MTDFSAEKTPASAAGTFSPESGDGKRYRIRAVQSGFGFMTSGKSFFLLRPGTVILTRPGEKNAFCFLTDASFPGFEFSGESAALMKGNAPGFAAGRNIRVVTSDALDRIIRLTDESIAEQDRHAPGFQLAVLEKLLAAERQVYMHGKDPGSVEARIAYSLWFITENYVRDITLKDLSGLTKMSISYYRRTFHRLLGISPIDCLLDYRLRQAAGLLAETSLPIGEIAAKTGFNDPNYFSRLFTARKGRPPRSWRISCRKK